MEDLFISALPERKLGVPLSYLASAAVVATTALVRYSLEGPLHHYPLLLFVLAVFACALFFDAGSGIFATVLSVLIAGYCFIEPRYSFAIGPENLFALLIFLAIGFTLARVTEALRRSVTRLNANEAAKALLFEELAHRTKNDLAIISSAITLQINATQNLAIREALSSANARVLVVARAQERLRGDVDGGLVALDTYVGALCQGLGDLLRDVRPIAIRVVCKPLRVPSSVAVHVGLIVNELVTNSLKYAYPSDSGGTVHVEVGASGAQLVVVVSDDGVGCSEEDTPGLGSRLIRLLAKQFGGTMVREASDQGCTVRVTLDETKLLPNRPLTAAC